MNFLDNEIKKLNDLSSAIRRDIEISNVLEQLRIELMEAKTDDDLNGIIAKYLESFKHNLNLYNHVASAHKRIYQMSINQTKFWDNLN